MDLSPGAGSRPRCSDSLGVVAWRSVALAPGDFARRELLQRLRDAGDTAVGGSLERRCNARGVGRPAALWPLGQRAGTGTIISQQPPYPIGEPGPRQASVV